MSEENQDVDPYVFVCSECSANQRIDPYTNPWVADMKTPPCRYCGGVVLYVSADTQEELVRARDNALKQKNRERGVPLT